MQNTHAMSLYQIGQHPLARSGVPHRLFSSFFRSRPPPAPSARGYLITQELAHKLPISVRINNLSPSPIVFTPELSLPGQAGAKGLARDSPGHGTQRRRLEP